LCRLLGGSARQPCHRSMTREARATAKSPFSVVVQHRQLRKAV
jgi:hypothetical protein